VNDLLTVEGSTAAFLRFLEYMSMLPSMTTALFMLIRSALSSLFRCVFNVVLADVYKAKLIARKMRNEKPRQGKYREVFDISLLIEHYRTMGDNAALQHSQLRAKVGTMLILYVMLRPEDMLRMDMSNLIETKGGMHFNAVLKNKPEFTECVLSKVEEEIICPVQAVHELWQRVQQRVPNAKDLFFNDDFTAHLNKYNLERGMRQLMQDAGVPSSVTPYAIKHAAITFLLTSGVDLTSINKNARLSLNAGTAARHYFVGEANKSCARAIAAAGRPLEKEFRMSPIAEGGVPNLNDKAEELQRPDVHQITLINESFDMSDLDNGGFQIIPPQTEDDIDVDFSQFLHVCSLFSPLDTRVRKKVLSPSGAEGE
jgi:integrase